MSQFQAFLGSEGPIGTGPILTIQGDTGLPVPPTIGGNVNILSENNPAIVFGGPPAYAFGVVEGNPATNTLFIAPVANLATTVDAVPQDIFELLIVANTSVVVTANVIGVASDFSSQCGGVITVIGRNDGTGTVVKTGGIIVSDFMGNPPPEVTASTVGNRLVISVQGVAGETWNWTAQITYIFNGE